LPAVISLSLSLSPSGEKAAEEEEEPPGTGFLPNLIKGNKS